MTLHLLVLNRVLLMNAGLGVGIINTSGSKRVQRRGSEQQGHREIKRGDVTLNINQRYRRKTRGEWLG